MTCRDTVNCTLPGCCGMCAGVQSTITLWYNATTPMSLKGTFSLSIYNATYDGVNYITSPIELLLLDLLIEYDDEACKGTSCPQVVGQSYKYGVSFKYHLLSFVKINFFGKIEFLPPSSPLPQLTKTRVLDFGITAKVFQCN